MIYLRVKKIKLKKIMNYEKGRNDDRKYPIGLLHGVQGGTDGKRCLQEDDKVAWPGTSCFSTSN